MLYTKVLLVSRETGGMPADTSVLAVRERVNDLLRAEREGVA